MVLIYGLLCAMAVVFAKLATRQQVKAKAKLATVDKQFKDCESDCKAEEVRSGRQAGLALQMKMMRAFEQREAANAVWKRKALKEARYQKLSRWLTNLAGRKVAYAGGLIDTMVAIAGAEMLNGDRSYLSTIAKLISQIQ